MRALALVEASARATPTPGSRRSPRSSRARTSSDDADASRRSRRSARPPPIPPCPTPPASASTPPRSRAASTRSRGCSTRSRRRPSPAASSQAARARAAARAAGRPLTLGERKSLARTHAASKLLLLLRDPHPAVVAILLDNPHLTESDIVRDRGGAPGGARRRSRTIARAPAVVGAPRGQARARLNPATPLADAIRIATTLARRGAAGAPAILAAGVRCATHAAEIAGRVNSDRALGRAARLPCFLRRTTTSSHSPSSFAAGVELLLGRPRRPAWPTSAFDSSSSTAEAFLKFLMLRPRRRRCRAACWRRRRRGR